MRLARSATEASSDTDSTNWRPFPVAWSEVESLGNGILYGYKTINVYLVLCHNLSSQIIVQYSSITSYRITSCYIIPWKDGDATTWQPNVAPPSKKHRILCGLFCPLQHCLHGCATLTTKNIEPNYREWALFCFNLPQKIGINWDRTGLVLSVHKGIQLKYWSFSPMPRRFVVLMSFLAPCLPLRPKRNACHQ